MASQGAKLRLKKNKSLLGYTIAAILLTNIIYCLFRFVLWNESIHFMHYVAFAGTTIIYLITFSMLKAQGIPKDLPNGEPDLSAVGDLGQQGVVEYCWDFIYISIFTQLTSLISDFFWYTFFIVFCYAFTMFAKSYLLTSKEEANPEMFMSRKERRAANKRPAQQPRR